VEQGHNVKEITEIAGFENTYTQAIEVKIT
jgi:hypothetical protein